MFKNYFLFIALCFSVIVISQNIITENAMNSCNDENCYKERVEEMVSLILPTGTIIESIERSEFPGIYKVYYGDIQPLYVSESGNYFMFGQMFKIDRQNANKPVIKNITDKDISIRRQSLMQEIKTSELISFESKREQYDLTVFTDVDCGYCRKLHKEIKQYNDLGITIRYAAFPRSGLGTDAFTKMVGAWCSADSKKAITNLKDGKNPNLTFCDSQPVAKHYAIGKKLGVTGTPAIITETGDLLPGYYSAEDLLKKLKG
jgi:thiol:disulfide interchange protein DsbC